MDLAEESSLCCGDKLKLRYWGLPEPILERYYAFGVEEMFEWQVECLTCDDVLNGGNLVYSAPTSAGKTLVSEIICLQTVLEKKKKVLIILPFVSVVREKMFYFQDLLVGLGVRVDGFMGSCKPPGGFSAVNIGICTIEKANNLVNRLVEEGELSTVGCIIVDELHLLGDSSRGYLLELLLTKIKYMCDKFDDVSIQVVGMSATLPNLTSLSNWLGAALYKTDFRPVPLMEYLKVNTEIYCASDLSRVRTIVPDANLVNDRGNVIQLCIETILEGFSVLVFCMSKNWCETLAQQIACAIRKIGLEEGERSEIIRKELNGFSLAEVIEQLKRCPAGLDSALSKAVSFAVAFHHAGLTLEERDIVEAAFRRSTIRVIVATSTLSSGVNLPARRVIIRSPGPSSRPIDPLIYKQMIGRAGRKGQDTIGESYLICDDKEAELGRQIVSSDLPAVTSCLVTNKHHLNRALLEVIALGIVSSLSEAKHYIEHTFLSNSDSSGDIISSSISYLVDNEFVKLISDGTGSDKLETTLLGKAALSASLHPDVAIRLLAELHKAGRAFNLHSNLHALYQVTPYSIVDQWSIDWVKVMTIWEELSDDVQSVGYLVGVEDRFLVRAMRGNISDDKKASIHRRFYSALALNDLVNEVPLDEVAAKYGCNKGLLQSLQQSAATFAGMVRLFCSRLGWCGLEAILEELVGRIQFGVQRCLLDLLRLDCFTAKAARALYNGGIKTVSVLARSTVLNVVNALRTYTRFHSNNLEGNGSNVVKYVQVIWIPGKQGFSDTEAAKYFIEEARKLLLNELGLKAALWEAEKELSVGTYKEPLHNGKIGLQVLNKNTEISSGFSPADKSPLKKDFFKQNQETSTFIGSPGNIVFSCDQPLGKSTPNNKDLVNRDDSSKVENNVSKVEAENEFCGLNLNFDGTVDCVKQLEIRNGTICDSSSADLFKSISIEFNLKSQENVIESIPTDTNSLKEVENIKEIESPVVCSEAFVNMDGNVCQVNRNSNESLILELDSNCGGDSLLESSFQVSMRSAKRKDCSINEGLQPKRQCTSSRLSDGDLFDSFELDSNIINLANGPSVDGLIFPPQQGGVYDKTNIPNCLSDCIIKSKLKSSPLACGDKHVNILSPTPVNQNACLNLTPKDKTIGITESLLKAFDDSFGTIAKNGEDIMCDTVLVEATPKSKITTKLKSGKKWGKSSSCSDLNGKQKYCPTQSISSVRDTIKKNDCLAPVVTPTKKKGDTSLISPNRKKIFKRSATESPGKYAPLAIRLVKTPERLKKVNDINPIMKPSEDYGINVFQAKNIVQSSDQSSKKLDEVPPRSCILKMNHQCELDLSLNKKDFHLSSNDSASDKLKISTCSQVGKNEFGKLSKVDLLEKEDLRNCSNSAFLENMGPEKLSCQFQSLDSVNNKIGFSCSPSLNINCKPSSKTVQPSSSRGSCAKFLQNTARSNLLREADNAVEEASGTTTTIKCVELCKLKLDFKSSLWMQLMSEKDLISVHFDINISSKNPAVPLIGRRIVRKLCDEDKQTGIITNEGVSVKGVSLCFSSCCVYYIDFTCTNLGTCINCLVNILKQCKMITCCNMKKTDSILSYIYGDFDFIEKLIEPSIAHWLLDPMDAPSPLLETMVKEVVPSFGCLSFVEGLCCKSINTLTSTLQLFVLQKELNLRLCSRGLFFLFTEVEIPVSKILIQLESRGLQLNVEKARGIDLTADSVMKDIENEAFTMVGRQFSFTSRTDLSKVREGTAAENDTHNRLNTLIHSWRKLSSLRTRNINPLIAASDKDGRIKPVTDTRSVTGRLIMREPSIQNVPRDFTINLTTFSFRSSFIPGAGKVFVGGDYCQLELRILAHFSEDQNLISFFKTSQDVFSSISSDWNSVELHKVTDDMRNKTKQLCYAIIYGMSDQSLGESMGVSCEDASQLSVDFKRKFPGLSKFTEKTVSNAKDCGYVRTLAGRRRFLPHINSSIPLLAAKSARQAINSRIQGSASDIAKLALVRLEKALISAGGLSKANLILHLHDEFIYEVDLNWVDQFSGILKETMEGAWNSLKVPLKVKLKYGKSWGEMYTDKRCLEN